MAKIGVFGAGMVGSAIAIDLALSEHQVVLIDKNINASLEVQIKFNELSKDALFSNLHQIQIIRTDIVESINNGDFDRMIKNLELDLVVSAVPGFLGFQLLENIIRAGINVVDISFFPEDAQQLHQLAIENNVTAVVDCGVAPGLDNLILGFEFQFGIMRERIESFECLVGGLPRVKKWPFNYKAPFSPIDVIEEYTRPARYVENKHIVVKEALSDCELVDFKNIGTLEAFNSDGLRSLISMGAYIPNMKEKTLRYPGHASLIQALKSSGFFSDKAKIGDVSPLQMTCRILFDEWKLEKEEEEFTVMRVTMTGHNDKSKNISVTYNLHDTYDKISKTSSMARTTGYTATGVAELVLSNMFNNKGVYPPELVGRTEGCFEHIIRHLNTKKIVLERTIKKD